MKVVGILIVLAALAACAERPEDVSGTVSDPSNVQAPCASDQSFTAWCGYKNPEDLAPTPDGNFLLATGFGGIPNPVLNVITLIDLRSMAKRDIEIVLADNTWGSADCTRTTKDFSTHGLDIILRRDGRHMVAMTNHLPSETVSPPAAPAASLIHQNPRVLCVQWVSLTPIPHAIAEARWSGSIFFFQNRAPIQKP